MEYSKISPFPQIYQTGKREKCNRSPNIRLQRPPFFLSPPPLFFPPSPPSSSALSPQARDLAQRSKHARVCCWKRPGRRKRARWRGTTGSRCGRRRCSPAWLPYSLRGWPASTSPCLAPTTASSSCPATSRSFKSSRNPTLSVRSCSNLVPTKAQANFSLLF